MQVRAVIGNPNEKALHVSIEVFDTDTGKTTLFLGNDIAKRFNQQRVE